MEQLGRRNLLQLFMGAGVIAAVGVLATRADAAALLSDETVSNAADAAVSGDATIVESGMEPTQSVVIRTGRRRPRVVVRPRRRRTVCTRRMGRTVCRTVY